MRRRTITLNDGEWGALKNALDHYVTYADQVRRTLTKRRRPDGQWKVTFDARHADVLVKALEIAAPSITRPEFPAITGTVTGRLSAKGPNPSNAPRHAHVDPAVVAPPGQARPFVGRLSPEDLVAGGWSTTTLSVTGRVERAVRDKLRGTHPLERLAVEG